MHAGLVGGEGFAIEKILFAYGINYLIDLQAAIIVDVQATPARWSAGVDATKDHAGEDRNVLWPQAAAACR